MASRQLLQPKYSSDALIWCCRQNFTQDFMAEALWQEDTRKFERFMSATSSIAFNLKNWISTNNLVEHVRLSHYSTASTKRTSTLSLPFSKGSSNSFSAYTLPYSQSLSILQPRFVAYSTLSGDLKDSDNSYTSTDHTPSLTLNSLKKILETDTTYLHIEQCQTLILHFLDSENPIERAAFFKIRNSVYNYLIKSRSLSRLDLIDKIINSSEKITKHDFAARLQCVIELSPQQIESTLIESLHLFSHKIVLELLFTTVRYLQKSKQPGSAKTLLLFQLYYSIILKQLGTLQLLDTDIYRMERRILSEIVLHQDSQNVINSLKILMKEKQTFASMLTSTIISICYDTNNFDFVVKLWKTKEEIGTETSYDLFKAMSAFIKLGQPDDSLGIYESHSELHEDWLFDVVLKTYASKQDWTGMQRIFESLFGRGDLPNLEHYRIVMDAVSKIAGTEIIETMYNNMLSRSLKPSVGIFNAMMYSYYAKGDLRGVLRSFDLLKASKIYPNSHSYNILLMMYRDQKDLESAREVIQEIVNKQMRVPRHLLTTVISLCAERNDVVNGEAVFGWISEAGHHPDTTSYNALLTCYTESRNYKKALDLFDEMQSKNIPLRIDTITIMLKFYVVTKNWASFDSLLGRMMELRIQPDSKLYSVLLLNLCERKQLESAEELIKALETSKETNKKLSIYHYSILMSGYLNLGNYERTIEIYNSLESLNLLPTFQTSAFFLSAVAKLGETSPKLKDRATEILLEYLNDRDSVDLTSNFTPRNTVTPPLAGVVLREYERTGNLASALDIAEKMKQQGGEENTVFHVLTLRSILETCAKAHEWDQFNKYWNLLFEALRKWFVPIETITATGEKKLVDRIPTRQRFAFDRVFRSKVFQMITFGEHKDIIGLVESLYSLGFKMSNRLLNDTVTLLVQNDETIEAGYRLANNQLMPYEYRRLKWRPKLLSKDITTAEYVKKVGQFSLKTNSKTLLFKRFERLLFLEQESMKKMSPPTRDITEDDALQRLTGRLPRVVPYIVTRLSKGQPQMDFNGKPPRQSQNPSLPPVDNSYFNER